MKKYILFIAGLLVLGIGYYGISPLFKNKKLDEVIPVADSTQHTSKAFPVIGTFGHPASGTVRIVKTPTENYVRYENFKTINGPDLYIYLAKDAQAKEFINLGRIKATEGNINYIIPAGINPDEYTYVLTWCKAFGVLFNQAELSQGN